MAEPDVIRYGTDSSGRPVLMTKYMAKWWEAIVHELGFEPVIVQGAWMARVGGGASASAGYHDGGGCLDLRVWDRTQTQVTAMIHALRWGGAAAWVRDAAHGGFDAHLHLVLGADHGLASGASWQFLNYVHGGDGLSSGGRDYHPRPNPLVTVPPDSLMEDPMADYAAQLDRIETRVKNLADAEKRRAERATARQKALLEELDALADEKDITVIKDRLKTIRQKVDAIPVDTDTE